MEPLKVKVTNQDLLQPSVLRALKEGSFSETQVELENLGNLSNLPNCPAKLA